MLTGSTKEQYEGNTDESERKVHMRSTTEEYHIGVQKRISREEH